MLKIRRFVTVIIMDGFGVFNDAERNTVWRTKTPIYLSAPSHLVPWSANTSASEKAI